MKRKIFTAVLSMIMLAGCGSMPYKEEDISGIETGDIVNVSSTTKRKSFGQAFCGKLPPPVLSILWSSHKANNYQ